MSEKGAIDSLSVKMKLSMPINCSWVLSIEPADIFDTVCSDGAALRGNRWTAYHEESF